MLWKTLLYNEGLGGSSSTICLANDEECLLLESDLLLRRRIMNYVSREPGETAPEQCTKAR